MQNQTSKITCNTDVSVTCRVSGRTPYTANKHVKLQFVHGEVSTLRSLTLTDLDSIELAGGIPESIEELTIDKVPYNEVTADFYDRIAFYFPNLKALTITNAHLESIGTLPKQLNRLNLSRNNLTKLPELPEGLIEIYLPRNRINSLPKTWPRNLRILVIGGNFLLGENEINQDIDTLQCDYTNGLTLNANFNVVTIAKCLGEDMKILKPIPLLRLTTARLNEIYLPDMVEKIQLIREQEPMHQCDLTHMANLKAIIAVTLPDEILLPKQCEYHTTYSAR